MNTTGHSILQIVKGIQRTPGDSSSSEQGLDSIDLLDPKGFSTDTYEMKIPALKSSAVFADSPLSDGRTLIAGTLGNVIETIRVTLTAGTIVQLSAMLSKLLRFKQDCNDFWDTFGQIEPIYIKHQVNGEPGPRYALLYDIDIAIDSVVNPSDPQRDITIVIEREYGWRGLAPGDNPKRWTIEQVMEGQKWNSTSAALLTGDNHLADQVIQNRLEYNTAGSALLTQNYMDIPATSIPGDLPALVEIAIRAETVTANGLNRIYVGKSSKPSLQGPAGEVKANYILVAADGGNNVDAVDANDTGAPIEASSGINRRKTISFATTTTLADRITWTRSLVGTDFEMASLRGRFMVFVRARLSAASTVTMNLRVQSDRGSFSYPTYTLTGVGSSGTGNTTFWQSVYMGIVTFPFNEQRIIIGDDGLGVDTSSGGDLILQATRVGVATNLYIADLILIPIDEGAWLQQSGEAIGAGNSWIYDNTGYYLHGRHGEYIEDNFSVATTEHRGSEFYLTPGKRNRLIMYADLSPNLAGTEAESGIDASFRFRVNIVPRWSGLRDV